MDNHCSLSNAILWAEKMQILRKETIDIFNLMTLGFHKFLNIRIRDDCIIPYRTKGMFISFATCLQRSSLLLYY